MNGYERHPSWLPWFFYAFFLTGLGLLCLFSVSHSKDLPLIETVFGKQVIWLCFGMVFFFLIQRMSISHFAAISYPVYALSLVLLLVVFAFSHQGVHRWIPFGGVRLQPSEVAKVGVLLVLSHCLAGNKTQYLSFKRLFGTFLLVLCPVILILKEPDLGTSIVFVVLWLALILWAHIHFAVILMLFVPVLAFVAGFHSVAFVALLVGLAVTLWFLRLPWLAKMVIWVLSLGSGLMAPQVWSHLAMYQKQRVLIFLGLQSDPRGAAYQVIQSKLAIGSGGFWGKGLLHGSQTQLRFLPEQHTDFIFSVLGEELGFVGVVLLLIVFFLIFIRGTLIAIKLKDPLASFLLAGCVVILSFQTFVNIAMTIGIAPVTGLPLPFLSYGGSSMCMSWILMGTIANLTSQRKMN